MATLVRRRNKKWSPGPPDRLERRRLKILSVWETGPSMSKPFIALASYCISLLGGVTVNELPAKTAAWLHLSAVITSAIKRAHGKNDPRVKEAALF